MWSGLISNRNPLLSDLVPQAGITADLINSNIKGFETTKLILNINPTVPSNDDQFCKLLAGMIPMRVSDLALFSPAFV